jgi:Asp-tRNA(Asn)/Glu-tRNA(Gln) amidotransferase A subunit family amidase
MQARIAQFERVNPQVNAIVAFHPEHALERVHVADARQARGEPLHLLRGSPTAHKDLLPTAQALPFPVEESWRRLDSGGRRRASRRE